VKNLLLFLVTAGAVDGVMETFTIAVICTQNWVFFLWTFFMAVITFRP
jgi:hypothetical protein